MIDGRVLLNLNFENQIKFAAQSNQICYSLCQVEMFKLNVTVEIIGNFFLH